MIKIILLSLFSFAAFGDLNGTWSGPGQWSMTSGIPPTACSNIEIKLSQNSNHLIIDRYHAKCGSLDSDWGPLDFEIKGSKVFQEGEEVGTFDGTIFKTLMPDAGVQYAFNFKILDLNHLETYYGVRNLVGASVIEGTVTLTAEQNSP